MIVIHWILWISIIVYLVSKRRVVDFYTIAISGFILYILPSFWGTTWTTQNLYYEKVHFETYIVIDLISIILFLSLLYNDKNKPCKIVESSIKQFPRQLFFLLGIISYLLMLIAVLKVGLSVILADNKSLLNIDVMNPFFSLSIWASLIVLSYGMISKNRTYFVIALPIIIFTLYLGSRAHLVIAAISTVLIWLSKSGEKRLFKEWKYGLVLVLVAVVATLYRVIYPFVKRGEYRYILSLLGDKEFYFDRIFVLPHEFYIVFSTLNLSVSNKLDLGVEFIFNQIINFIPLLSRIVDTPNIKYSEIIMQNYYQGSRFGMASNIWAEMYSSGGVILVILFTIIWVKIINFFNRQLIYKRRMSPFFIPFGVYSTFYINRLSFSLALGDMKYILFLLIISIVIYNIFLKPYMKPNRQQSN